MAESTAEVIWSQCPVCQGADVRTFFTLPNVPVLCNVLYPTLGDARNAARGDIQLNFCRTCGHIYNARFDPNMLRYAQNYENSLHFSPSFQRYITAQIDDLIARHDLHDKTIVDVGCGKGEFLTEICERGPNRGFGFDPSYVPTGTEPESVQFVQDLYSEKYSEYHADLVACRHVLEHVAPPTDLIRAVYSAIATPEQTTVFFEVPNALYTVRDMGIWDIIYEHFSYFTANSLFAAFARGGYLVHQIQETYGGQFLTIETQVGTGEQTTLEAVLPMAQLDAMIEAFAENDRRKKQEWGEKLSGLAAEGQRTVVWGSGSKGVTFVNALHAQAKIDYMVDINPRKHGMFVAGTGQKIVPPDFLRGYQPDLVLIMNPIYRNEIQQMLSERGIQCEVQLV